jgi:dTDP-4-amino-4,6-dideoxygalactose transaminase
MGTVRIRIASPPIGEEEKRAVAAVLDSGMVAMGPRVAEFERDFAKLTGAKHAIAVSNGTVALHLALLALGVKKGGRVVTTPFSFAATANCALMVGARPEFRDVDLAGNLAIEGLRRALKGAAALLPVHLYGRPCAIREMKELCDRAGVPLVEDAAQAVGSKLGGKHAGTFGTVGSFSLYATKNITTGEGGVLVTDDEDIADRLRQLRSQGQRARYDYVALGYNFRMTDIAGAIGIEQLKKLPSLTAARRRNARALSEGLAGLDWLAVPEDTEGHVYHQYTVRVLRGSREALISHLAGRGIESSVHYPKALYAYPHLRRFKQNCPCAERLAAQVLSLPVHPALGEAEIEEVVEAVRLFRP